MSALEHYKPVDNWETMWDVMSEVYYTDCVRRGIMTEEQATKEYRHVELGGTAISGY